MFQGREWVGVSEEELRALFESAVATMAKLHDLNWKGLGLECLGDSEDYLRKRVSLRMLDLVVRKLWVFVSCPLHFLQNFAKK